MRTVLSWCAVAAIGVGTAVVAAGQRSEPPTAAPAAVFRSAVDLVALNVIVTDGGHRFVTGLERSDFVVFEDGVAQEVTFFSAGEAPLDVALLLDTSASMTQQLPAVRQAARGFLRIVRDIDRVMVLDLKNTTRVLHPLGGDIGAAQRAIESIQASGTTSLYNGLYLTLRQLASVRGADAAAVRRQAIVVLSDGRDTSSLLSYEDVRELARRSETAIYAIQLESPVQRLSGVSRVLSRDEYTLRELAAETGGRAYFPDRIEDLAGVYESIAAELTHQYALGYTPKAEHTGGGFRRVTVQVLEHPGVRTRTRAGYLARTGT